MTLNSDIKYFFSKHIKIHLFNALLDFVGLNTTGETLSNAVIKCYFLFSIVMIKYNEFGESEHYLVYNFDIICSFYAAHFKLLS